MRANATTRASYANHEVIKPNIGDKSKPRQHRFSGRVERICTLQ